LVERVMQIRGLLDAGLPTRIIKQILPCLDVPGILVCPSDATPEMLEALERERDRMTERIDLLTRNRDAIDAYVEAVRNGRRIDAPASRPTVPQPV
jgi:DNA-binding transcriptional MerR regulator